ncbi:MAG: hypothetical protein MZV64_33465 [Ignavibacteriales bacterium]|nr:hypothetical protein [Ignavibacteriales bacterium]
MQGILEVMYRLEDMLKEISGMDRVTLQPGAGSAAIYANVAMIRAYHESRGEGANAHRGHHILVLASVERRGGEGRGIQDHHPAARCRWLSRFRGVESRRLASGPPRCSSPTPRTRASSIRASRNSCDLVHKAGGLCSYDQANANGLLGITRAREAGFDVCHFNLHKTFSTPHGCGGPAAGACGVTQEMAPFLPDPDR